MNGRGVREVRADSLPAAASLNGESFPLTTNTKPKESLDVRQYLAASLKDGWKRFRKRLRSCQRDFSEKAVHDSRVESRRLLSTLELLGALLPDRQVAKARRNLKRYLDTFDELRDTHVQLILIETRIRKFPELQSFHDALCNLERRCIKETARRIKRTRLTQLRRSVRELEAELRHPPCRAARRQLGSEDILRALHTAFARVVELNGRVESSDTDTIHRVRVAFKKYRYMLEAVGSLLPGVTPRKLEAMKKFQALMGELQDIEVLLRTVDRFTRKEKIDASVARNFHDELVRRSQRLIALYLKQAGKLDRFWPLTASPG